MVKTGRVRASIECLRITLDQELAELRAELDAEGELVVRSLRGCVRALVEGDVELADEVIAFDDEVDAAYQSVENGIQTLLARQTPVAADLRLVLAMLHINLHLERIADYCVTVAKLTKLASGLKSEPSLVEGFEEMGTRAEEMIRVALESFADGDLARAESLVELDELIDRVNRHASNKCSRSETIQRSANGESACSSSPAAWSGSVTTQWTSASRRRTS